MATIPASFSQFVNAIIQAKTNKTKVSDWKTFFHPEKKINLNYQVIKCDVISNLSSVSHHATNFSLALADIPYGLNQEGSDWDTSDWTNPEEQVASVSFINL